MWFQDFRYAEFAQAITKRELQGATPAVTYYGLLRADQRDVITMLEAQCYQRWDLAPDSPARQRPPDATSQPPAQLSCLTWSNDLPGFPQELLAKFADGTHEHAQMAKLKSEFDALVPEAARAPAARTETSSGSSSRARGSPDFTIDDGKEPLDVSRVIDLRGIPAVEFTVQRPLNA